MKTETLEFKYNDSEGNCYAKDSSGRWWIGIYGIGEDGLSEIVDWAEAEFTKGREPEL